MIVKKCRAEGCFSDATCCDGLCAKHTLRMKKKRQYRGHAKPRTATPHLGVEIECFGGSEMAHKVMLAQAKSPHYDGSLPDYGCEYKFCMEAKKAIRQIPRFAEKLVSVGALVNRSCGFHVHLDMRGIPQNRKDEFLKWMATWQEWWFSLMPESRRGSSYCQRLQDSITSRVSHYSWLNRTSYQTIEIRIHGGTLNPHKIRAWLTVCKDLMNLIRSPLVDFVKPPFPAIEYKEGTTSPTDSFLQQIFSREAIEYLRSRERSGGVLESVQATANGPVAESE